MLVVKTIKNYSNLVNMNKIDFQKLKNEIYDLNQNLTDIEAEKIVEIQYDTNNQNTTREILNWYEDLRNNLESTIELIDLETCDQWKTSNKQNVEHESGNFFKIMGVRTRNSSSREVGNQGWDQPIIIEKDFDGGLLGLVRSYINGTPHYLVEAKFEPGNFNLLQLSPTLQATFSNLNKAHGGKEPNFTNYFLDHEESNDLYLFNQWLSEDGGRLFNKRNKGLVKNINYEDIGDIPKNFIWVSLYQIREFINEHTIVNPHLARLIFLF